MLLRLTVPRLPAMAIGLALAVTIALLPPVAIAEASAASIQLSPSSGAVGTTVTLDAENFARGQGGSSPTLRFGSALLSCCDWPNGHQSLQATFTVPAGYSGDVTVRLARGTSSATATFRVMQPATPPAPEPEPKPEPEPVPDPGPDPHPDPGPDPGPDEPVEGLADLAFTAEPSTDCAGPCAEATAIWGMNADGSQPAPVTAPEGAYDRFPRWSPDGKKLAFTRTQRSGGGAEVYILEQKDGDLTSPRRVSTTTDSNDGRGCDPASTVPVWAPDSSRLAFACGSEDASQSTIQVASSDGIMQFTVPRPAGATDTSPTWSPASDQLAFARQDGTVLFGDSDRIAIWLADIGTSAAADARALVSGARAADHPRWSPTGDQIAYVETDELTLGSALRTVSASGRSPTTVYTAPTDRLVSLYEAVWSPDGTRLVIPVGDGVNESAVHAVAVSTGDTPQLSPSEALSFAPSWSPEGDRVVFDVIAREGDDERHDIATAAADGSSYNPLPVSGFFGFDAHWRP